MGLVKGFSLRPQNSYGRALLPLVNHQVPVVCLDRRVADMDLDSVLVDNVAGAWLAVSHLVALGHRRIRSIGGRPLTPESERLAGYRQGLATHAIPEDPELVRRGDSLQPSGYTDITDRSTIGWSMCP
jgi:LacI family transcriptional regulator